jgi:hypothetical protein
MLSRAIGNTWKIMYKDTRGNISIRNIKLYENKDTFLIGRTNKFTEKQLIINVYDLDKNEFIQIASKNIIKWY